MATEKYYGTGRRKSSTARVFMTRASKRALLLAWHGGAKWALWADEPSREISGTDVIWEFFRSHPKRD